MRKGKWVGFTADPNWVFGIDNEDRQMLAPEKPLILDFGDRQKTLVESYNEWIEYKLNNGNRRQILGS